MRAGPAVCLLLSSSAVGLRVIATNLAQVAESTAPEASYCLDRRLAIVAGDVAGEPGKLVQPVLELAHLGSGVTLGQQCPGFGLFSLLGFLARLGRGLVCRL